MNGREYQAAVAAVADFEGKLAKAKADEASALTDDTAPEAKVVSRIRDAQGLQQVFSRRLELARERITLEPLRQAILEAYWELDNKVSELVKQRMNADQAFFLARPDVDSFRSALVSGGYFVMQSPIVTLCENAVDVLNAYQCKPRFVWANNAVHDGTGLTLQRLQEDVSRLTECESAYETEAAREYDFTVAPQQESQDPDREPEFAQTV